MKKLFTGILPVFVIMSMLIGACANMPVAVVSTSLIEASATPKSVVTPAASATLTAPQSDDVWDRIVANKKIVVGTSWDYPPFSSVDPAFHAVGLDIALIEEIGRRLNIPVEVQNFSFAGLPDALQINQIDLAVAAISITPERASQMSFSPVYYVNQTAILARNGSSVTTITDFKQLAGLRVGVETGSTYENMAQSLLVDTKLMGADKLLRYRQADEAVRDLIANRLDVVVIGQATAKYYNSSKELRVVGKGFDEQNLAVAMRLGTPRLQAEVNRVMDDMLTDGTILGFIQQYIQSDFSVALPTSIPPNQSTATPLPPIPTAKPPACWNGMKFVADVTYLDNNMKSPQFVKPGAGFSKTWRIQNTGTCTWTTSYRLVYAYGNVDAAQMNGQPVNIPSNVASGQMIDLSVTLIAPTYPLTYQGFWQIQNESGRKFGQTIWVGITTQSDQNTTTANACVVKIVPPKKPVTVNSGFDAVWAVKNTSGIDWSSNSVDYKFISGSNMREKDVYDLAETIKNGETGNIIVDMNAPGTPGIYYIEWAIVSGSKTLCIMPMSITVNAK